MSKKLGKKKGKPTINVIFNFVCDVNGFLKKGNNLPVETIEVLHTLAERAKCLLGGPLHVTDDGFLFPGWKGEHLPLLKGMIDIVKNLASLHSFNKPDVKRIVITFDYSGNGGVGELTIDKRLGILLADRLSLERFYKEFKKSETEDSMDLDLIDHGVRGFCLPSERFKE